MILPSRAGGRKRELSPQEAGFRAECLEFKRLDAASWKEPTPELADRARIIGTPVAELDAMLLRAPLDVSLLDIDHHAELVRAKVAEVHAEGYPISASLVAGYFLAHANDLQLAGRFTEAISTHFELLDMVETDQVRFRCLTELAFSLVAIGFESAAARVAESVKGIITGEKGEVITGLILADVFHRVGDTAKCVEMCDWLTEVTSDGYHGQRYFVHTAIAGFYALAGRAADARRHWDLAAPEGPIDRPWPEHSDVKNLISRNAILRMNDRRLDAIEMTKLALRNRLGQVSRLELVIDHASDLIHENRPARALEFLEEFDPSATVPMYGWRLSRWKAAAHLELDEFEACIQELRLWKESVSNRYAEPPQADQFLPGDEPAILSQSEQRCADLQAKAAATTGACGEVFAELAHDLRTPLAALSLVPLDQTDPAAIEQSLNSLGRLIEDLPNRIWALVGADPIDPPVSPNPFPVEPLVRNSVSLVAPHAESKNIRLSWNCEPGLIGIGNEVEVSRAVLNILSNAVKYSPEGGNVVVRAEAVGGLEFTIEVADSGPGINDEEITSIFERGSLVSATPTGGESRSGRGLFIAHSLVAANGGTISVRSSKTDGSTFSIRLGKVKTPPRRTKSTVEWQKWSDASDGFAARRDYDLAIDAQTQALVAAQRSGASELERTTLVRLARLLHQSGFTIDAIRVVAEVRDRLRDAGADQRVSTGPLLGSMADLLIRAGEYELATSVAADSVSDLLPSDPSGSKRYQTMSRALLEGGQVSLSRQAMMAAFIFPALPDTPAEVVSRRILGAATRRGQGGHGTALDLLGSALDELNDPTSDLALEIQIDRAESLLVSGRNAEVLADLEPFATGYSPHDTALVAHRRAVAGLREGDLQTAADSLRQWREGTKNRFRPATDGDRFGLDKRPLILGEIERRTRSLQGKLRAELASNTETAYHLVDALGTGVALLARVPGSVAAMVASVEHASLRAREPQSGSQPARRASQTRLEPPVLAAVSRSREQADSWSININWRSVVDLRSDVPGSEIEAMVQDLLRAALSSTPVSGTVTINGLPGGPGWVLIHVIDGGPGFDQPGASWLPSERPGDASARAGQLHEGILAASRRARSFGGELRIRHDPERPRGIVTLRLPAGGNSSHPRIDARSAWLAGLSGIGAGDQALLHQVDQTSHDLDDLVVSWSENGPDPERTEPGVVLRRDDATDHHPDVGGITSR